MAVQLHSFGRGTLPGNSRSVEEEGDEAACPLTPSSLSPHKAIAEGGTPDSHSLSHQHCQPVPWGSTPVFQEGLAVQLPLLGAEALLPGAVRGVEEGGDEAACPLTPSSLSPHKAIAEGGTPDSHSLQHQHHRRHPASASAAVQGGPRRPLTGAGHGVNEEGRR